MTVSASLTGRGGSVRADIRLEGPRRDLIREVLITGDFFVTPPRVIFDLEARLRGLEVSDAGPAIDAYFARTPADFLSLGAGRYPSRHRDGVERAGRRVPPRAEPLAAHDQGVVVWARSPSSASAAGFREARMTRARSGGCCARAETRFAKFHLSAGALTASTTPRPTIRSAPIRNGAAFSTISHHSIRLFSAYRAARPKPWTRSSASCCRWPMRRLRTPAFRSSFCARAAPASSSASPTRTTACCSASSRASPIFKPAPAPR